MAVLLLAIGCTNIKYIGDSYPATTRVDVFFSEEDVEYEYRVIGHAVTTAPEYVDTDAMMKKIKEKAMEKGADAIIVLGFDENVVGQSTEWGSETKTDKNKTTETGYEKSSTTKENEIRVLFVRYRRDTDKTTAPDTTSGR
jgi:hypothetical protein